MSWFSKYVGDPLKALLAKAVAEGTAELKTLAGDVAASLPASPVSASAETAFVSGIQTVADALLHDSLGEVPAVGQTLDAAAEAAANAAIAHMVATGTAALNALAAEAKAALGKVSGASSTNPTGAETAASGA